MVYVLFVDAEVFFEDVNCLSQRQRKPVLKADKTNHLDLQCLCLF
jgi:hypothetical protein